MTRSRNGVARLVLAGALMAALVAGARGAHAQGQSAATADCRVFEIKATSEGEGVDPALRPLARKLTRPPFSSWKAFKLLKQHDRTVEKMKALVLELVTGSKLSLLFRGANGGQPSKARLRLTFAIDDKNGKRKVDGTINLDSGDYSLIGGDSIEGGGTYILAVSCRAP